MKVNEKKYLRSIRCSSLRYILCSINVYNYKHLYVST